MVSFTNTPSAPPDVILGLTTAVNSCTAPDKVNLGVGAYRTEQGLPYVFKSVIKAEEDLLNETKEGKENKEYLGSSGHPGFITECQKILFGDQSNRFASVQAVGGTGGLRVAMEFAKISINNFDLECPTPVTLLTPKPTWPNHHNVARHAGLTLNDYDYFDNETLSVDDDAMVKSLDQLVTPTSVILLHAIGHNPTGADPSVDTFRKVFQIIQDRGAVCMLDIAYQGFVSGSLVDDLENVKIAYNEFPEMNLLICQSFSKNMGMYGERLGALHVSCSPESAAAVVSQLNLIIRRMYSNPPRHPSDIGFRVLRDYYKEWSAELQAVAESILQRRIELKDRLVKFCPQPGNWEHITNQKGMFAYTGLKPAEVKALKEEHNIFMAGSGRISIAGLNASNFEKVAKAIAVVRKATL